MNLSANSQSALHVAADAHPLHSWIAAILTLPRVCASNRQNAGQVTDAGLLQAAGALCVNTAGGLLLVGSADGSLTLEQSKLGSSDHLSSNIALHDMWAGEPVHFVPTKNIMLRSAWHD